MALQALGPAAASPTGAVRVADVAPYVAMVPAITGGTPITITHGLNNWNVQVVISRSFLQSGALVANVTPGQVIDVTWRKTGPNTITLEPDESWAANEFIIAVIPGLMYGVDNTGPTAGSLSSPSQTQTTITLHLTGGTDAGLGNAGINFYRTVAGTPTFVGTTDGSDFTDTGLTANTSYTYTAKRYDYMGIEGAAATLTVSTAVNPNPPAFDSSSISAGSGVVANNLSQTWSHTPVAVVAGAGVVVEVICSNQGSADAQPSGTPTCTYGGVSLTYKGFVPLDIPIGGFIAVFAGNTGIPTGSAAQTVTYNISSGGTHNFGNTVGVCKVYNGVGSIGTMVSAHQSTTNQGISDTTSVNDIVVGCAANYSNGAYSGLPPTWNTRKQQGSTAGFVSGDMPTSAGTTAFTATQSSTAAGGQYLLELMHA
jgi:hypothetical protein